MKIHLRLAGRMSLAIILTSLLVLSGMALATNRYIANLLQAQTQENLDATAGAIANDVGAFLSGARQIALNVAAADQALFGNVKHLDIINQQLRETLLTAPDVLDAYVAFESGAVGGWEYLFRGWQWQDGAPAPIAPNIPGMNGYDPDQPLYDYQQDDNWYLVAKNAGHFAWGPPYADEGGMERQMISAVTPITVKGVFQGVAGVDLSLDHLNEILSQYQVGETGYAFIVGQRGEFIAHPTQAELTRAGTTLAELATSSGQPELQTVAAEMAAGGRGFRALRDPVSGAPIFLAYAPITSTGWSLGLAQPQAGLS